MRKKLVILLTVAALAVGTGVLLFRHQPILIPLSAPVTLRYTYGPSGSGRATDEPVFWVTNHTGKDLAVTLGAIEIQTDRGWTGYSQIPFPGLLYFTNTPGRVEALLGPRAAGFGSLLAQSVTLPTNTVWRVRASVVEKLVGGEDVVAAIVREPGMLRVRSLTGNTNFPVNPFRKDGSRFGHSSVVVSEAVVPR
jgi:hypothetical protein